MHDAAIEMVTDFFQLHGIPFNLWGTRADQTRGMKIIIGDVEHQFVFEKVSPIVLLPYCPPSGRNSWSTPTGASNVLAHFDNLVRKAAAKISLELPSRGSLFKV